ncbi:unnamed protein product, partial [Polarella glacialis]
LHEMESPERWAEELFAQLDTKGLGYLGPGELLNALSSEFFSESPHMARALASASVRARGSRLRKEDFVRAVLSVLPASPTPPSSCGALEGSCGSSGHPEEAQLPAQSLSSLASPEPLSRSPAALAAKVEEPARPDCSQALAAIQ